MRVWRWVIVRVEEVDGLIDVVRDALEHDYYCRVERDPWQCDEEYVRDKLADALQETLNTLRWWRGDGVG